MDCGGKVDSRYLLYSLYEKKIAFDRVVVEGVKPARRATHQESKKKLSNEIQTIK